MKRILIINTGGTISMVPSQRGYVPDGAGFGKRLSEMELLKPQAGPSGIQSGKAGKYCNSEQIPSWDLMETEPLLDSSNMTVADWNRIGRLIAENYGAYDGFVILHGTDTMAYTASALSFMLEGLDKPVILTGAQIPLGEIRSDGRDNLINSLLIAAEGRAREVCIFFGGKLLRGNRATKYSADELIAFVSPNYPALAEAGISVVYNEAALLKSSSGAGQLAGSEGFRLQLLDEIPIGVIKVFPGIQFSLFEQILTEKLKGIVIETFGAGNIPGNGSELLPLVRKALANGTVITVCSQCPQGTVSLGTYETSSALAEAGAVSGRDLTTEAAVAKLYYLFSKGCPAAEVKRLMELPLCGEER